MDLPIRNWGAVCGELSIIYERRLLFTRKISPADDFYLLKDTLFLCKQLHGFIQIRFQFFKLSVNLRLNRNILLTVRSGSKVQPE